MTKISQYIVKEFLLYFLTCIMALLVITTVFSALSELKLLEKPDGTALFVEAILSGIPLLIEIITPVSVLLATVLTFTSLSKSSEIIAMMAAGVSLFRMMLPILMAGLFIAFFTYFNQSYLARWWGADKRVSVVKSVPSAVSWQFYKGELFFFSDLSKRDQHVARTNVYSFSPQYELTSVRSFNNLSAEGESWVYTEGESRLLNGGAFTRKAVSADNMPKNSMPVIFKNELSHPKYSNFVSLLKEIWIKRQGAVDFESDLFALYQKASNMITIFVMILLALPFSLFSGRSSNVRTGIVISVIIGFVFWLADQIFVSLQSAGGFPILISAFAANLIFFILFLFLIKARKV